jgi:hypothetical protein
VKNYDLALLKLQLKFYEVVKPGVEKTDMPSMNEYLRVLRESYFKAKTKGRTQASVSTKTENPNKAC